MQEVSELRTEWSTADEIVIFVSRRALISQFNPSTCTSDIIKTGFGAKLAFNFPLRLVTSFQILSYFIPIILTKHPVFLPLLSRNC